MNDIESATRVAIWLSVGCWGAAHGFRFCRSRNEPLVCWLWSVGAVFYFVHVVLAFAGFYKWSHSVALAETARQTGEAIGFESGAGLWLNYLFGILWGADTVRAWVTGVTFPSGTLGHFIGIYHGFLAFMIFNGTVVFGHGPVRWFGWIVFTCLAALWLRARLSPTPAET